MSIIDMNNPITRSVLRPAINPMYDLLEQNIGIEFPLYINDIKYDKNNYTYHIFVVYHSKALFTCSECCTENLKVIHKRLRIFQGLDILNSETQIHINLPILLCPKCGKNTTYTPNWATKKSNLTVQLQHRLLAEATIMPLSDITKRTGIKPSRITDLIKHYVHEAVANDDWSDVKKIGIYEIAIRKGHDYITVFVDQEKNRFLYAVKDKGMSNIENFCSQLLLHNSAPENMTEVAIDMSPSYSNEVSKYFNNAHITFDKFHVMNSRIHEIKRRARGYPNTNNLINMLHLCLGKLPIPKLFGKGSTFSQGS